MAQGAVAGRSTMTAEPGTESAAREPGAVGAASGSGSAPADVVAARAEAVRARAALSGEVVALRRSARDAFDLRARLARLPADLARDPAKAAGAGAAAVGSLLAVAALRRRGRKARTAILPEEIDAALAGLGKDRERVRKALDASFAQYLEEHGTLALSERRRVRRVIGMVAAPIVGQALRSLVKRAMQPPAERRSSTRRMGD